MTKFFRIFASVLLLSLISNTAFAQNSSAKKSRTDSITLKGSVFDGLTSRPLLDTRISILRPDSSVITSVEGGNRYWTYKNDKVFRDSNSNFEISLPRVHGDYIIKVTKKEYEDLYEPYKPEFGARTSELKVPNLYLRRPVVKQLEEYTVKSSKIKFYNKGDTIVYNADAFSLPEGSMLDALVRQMPGVEIKGDKIYVNGRFVESLLLNGKDFFKGNQAVAMQNIGAYAVKNVAVYEKQDESAQLLGERADIDKELVMDVRLKKDYMTGYSGHAEAGYGTGKHYLGRLFALGYTNNSRVSLYGNANNMNISNRLNENGQDYATNRDRGIMERVNGGIDYLVDNALHTWEVSGNVDAHYTDNKQHITSNAVEYLQAVDNFTFSDKSSRMHNLKLSTNHEVKLNREGWNLRIMPKFEYNKAKEHNDNYSATFNKEFDGMSLDIVKNLYAPSYRDFTKALINRNIQFYNSSSHGYKSEMALASKIKIPGSPDAIELKGNVRYNRSTQWGTTLQDICFGDNQGDGLSPVSSLLQRRDEAVRPDYTFRLLGLARYYFNLPFGSLNLSYEYIHTQNRKNSGLMMLESMAQGTMAEFLPGQLPMPDMANSYAGKTYKNQHHLKLIYGMTKKYDIGKLELKLEPSIYLERHDLFYTQGDASVNPAKTFWRVKIDNTRLQWSSKNSNTRLYLYYSLDQTAPNLLKMVDIPNTSDPMNIWLGNPDLKMSTNQLISFDMQNKFGKRTSQYFRISVNLAHNDIVNGFRYDSATGVRQMKTYNVNGNNNFEASYTISQDLDKKGIWSIRNTLFGNVENYSNMVGYDADPTRQKTRSYGIYEYLAINKDFYENDMVSFYLAGMLSWNKAVAGAPNPTKNNYGYYGANGGLYLRLPLNFGINTDCYLSKYFGYVDSSMNRLRVLWNASLTYTMLKGKLRFTLKGTDLLNNSTYQGMMVSATGHTQSEEMSLGRVIMLTATYKFQIKPKRR